MNHDDIAEVAAIVAALPLSNLLSAADVAAHFRNELDARRHRRGYQSLGDRFQRAYNERRAEQMREYRS